jgi:hypothetical protein
VQLLHYNEVGGANMREILFRGKCKGNNCDWLEGYLFDYDIPKQSYILGELDWRESIYDIWKCAEEVIPKTVGQFTGLTDKNGKRIFEGDIVKNDKYFMLVEWYDFLASFALVFSPNGSYHETISNSNIYLEVVGNLHDNPELLGG